jgi:hypothetical protein
MRKERKEREACDFSDHGTGNAACHLCERVYPRPCDCGGLVHAAVANVERDGYLQWTWCDRCGRPR